jgi:CheY-like chemotaxis protein
MVTARSEGGEVVVAVTDTGRGIAADMIPHVFELFVQERQNIDRSQGGLGLGLAIVRSLVALHGGRVEATSGGPGAGSTFEVRLPLLATTAEPLAAAVPLPEPVRSGVSVLIVDDNIDAAELLADLLASRGYHTRVAHDAPQALALAKEFVPDVALLDIGLPAMDGYELARRLRELSAWQGVRLFAVTGYGQLGDKERSKESGFDHHLVKPIDFAMLQGLMPPARSAP